MQIKLMETILAKKYYRRGIQPFLVLAFLLLFVHAGIARSNSIVISNKTVHLQGESITDDSIRNQIWPNQSYQLTELFYHDDFSNGLQNWVIESKLSPNAKVEIQHDKLVLDVNCGATIWLKKKLAGNVLIRYTRKVIMDNGLNDRLSDLNTFWMATDPKNENLFTRQGIFSTYDSLSLYYAGIGGNSNQTTRFRKYTGNGERVLLSDYADEVHLLQANKTYLVEIAVYNGTTTVFVDHKLYFTYDDENPLTEGYFGFRTVKSRQEIDDLEIFRLE